MILPIKSSAAVLELELVSSFAPNINTMNFNTISSIATGGILLFSLGSMYFDLLPNQWLRLGTSGIFLLFAFQIFSSRNLYGLAVFFLLFLCDLFLVFWENSLLKTGYYLAHILAIAILVFLTVREIKFPKVSLVEILSLFLFFVINTLILFLLEDYFNQSIDSNWLRILFYANGILILVLVLCAFFYSISFANDVSAYLFLAVMGLTISDLLLFGIYFTEFEVFRYIDNAFYSVGLYFLLQSYLEHRKLKKKGSEKVPPENNNSRSRNVYR